MSLGSTQPFRPSGTVTLAATTTPLAGALVGRGEAVLVYNASTGVAFLRFGTDLTITATLSDVPVPAGTRMLLHAGTIASTVSVVLGGGSGSVYVSRGDGTVY